MTTQVMYYERRKDDSNFQINNRRLGDRRKVFQPFYPERRRLSSQVRHYERETLKMPVEIVKKTRGILGYTEDISLEGLRILTGVEISPGTTLDLEFRFNGDVCSVKIPGRVIYCRLAQENEQHQTVTGITFSNSGSFEKKILALAIRALKSNSASKSSLLTITIGNPDEVRSETHTLLGFPETLKLMPADFSLTQLPIPEKRFSPRLSSVQPDEVPGNGFIGKVLNLSETGVSFESETPPSSEEIRLLINLSPSVTEQPLELSAKITWGKNVTKDKFQYGAEFLHLNERQSLRLREFLFEAFAKEASDLIKKNENLKNKVYEFFRTNIREYHASLSTLMEKDSQGDKAHLLEAEVETLTNRLLLQGDALETIDEREVKKVKELFRKLISCWVYKSPIMNMAYSRPRGYPGDFGLFEILYENRPLSEGIGGIFDKYFLNNTYTVAVRSRKDKMKKILRNFIENSHLPSVKLLNVACGPCREIRELFEDPSFVMDKKISFTGLDNDAGALEFSKLVLNHLPLHTEVRFVNENVLNLFRDSKYHDLIGKQDVIYILGLTEYLPDRIFQKLIGFLFELLNYNGMLVITYKDKNIPFPAIPPAWLCDWTFIKRSEDDLIKAASSLGEGKYSLRIERESTGCIFFLILTKLQNNEHRTGVTPSN